MAALSIRQVLRIPVRDKLMFARRVTETSRRKILLVGRRCCQNQNYGQTDDAQSVALHNHISRVTLSLLLSPSDKIVGNPCEGKVSLEFQERQRRQSLEAEFLTARFSHQRRRNQRSAVHRTA